MDIRLKTLALSDASALHAFELENRSFFETMVPGRGDAYFQEDNFREKLADLLDEQRRDESWFYLIMNPDDEILGRINLVDLDPTRKSGHAGYRVAEAYTGRGIANKGLALLIDAVSKRGITKLFAKTTTNNIASQRVLEKNGFNQLQTEDEVVELNGEMLRFVNYEWTGEMKSDRTEYETD